MTGDPPVWLLIAVGVALFVGVLLLIVALKRGGGGASKEQTCPGCKRIIPLEWPKCRFCKTPLREQRGELQFLSGPLQGQVLALDREVTTIGSVQGNTVLLQDTGVSRKHVGIRKLGEEWELADLGSTNGTFVNGEKVARRKLEVGDVIRVGTSEMKFRA